MIFGSALGPRLYNVFNILKFVFVTIDFPSTVRPPSELVTHVGSPANISLYSGVLKCLTSLNLITKSSIISCASSSVRLPSAKSLSAYISRNVVILPILFAAPFCSFTAPRYPKYNHCTASLKFCAGFVISQPY